MSWRSTPTTGTGRRGVARRDGLAEEKQRELDAIKRRYENVRELVFPFAVALCVPEAQGVPDEVAE